MKTFMSVPPCGLCFKAPNGYVPLAGFRSERAEIAFSPFSGGLQPSHLDNGSSLKLLYLGRNSAYHNWLLFPLPIKKTPLQNLLEIICVLQINPAHFGNTNTDHTSWDEPWSPHLWHLFGFSWKSAPEDSGPEKTTSRTSQPTHCSRWH